jgi:hypothetical protein
MEIDPYSLAFEAAIRTGSLIQKVKVNQNAWQEVTSGQEFDRIVGKPKAGDRILLYGLFRDDLSDPPHVTDYRALVVPAPVK